MGAGWFRLSILGLTVCLFAGCLNSQRNLKPPKIADEYLFPPSGDSRFVAYPTYPARVMDGARIRAEQQAQATDMTPGMQGPGPH